MGKSITVKTHSRTSSKGKTTTVRSHTKLTKTGKGESKSKETSVAFNQATQDLAKKRIDPKLSAEIIQKYKKYPHNLNLMVNGKWKNVLIDSWKTDKDGKRTKFKSVQRQLSFTNEQWSKLIKDNSGLVYKVIQNYNWNPEIFEDLKSVAIKSIFEAANNYEGKFDPKNPPDIAKHFQLHMSGSVRAEVAKQLATRFSLPYQKRVIYQKFTNLYDEHGGDFDAIYKKLNLTKKDLYPAINDAEANDPLPREGYVSVTKAGVLDKKTKAYQDKVNLLRSEYELEKGKLLSRLHGGGEGEKEIFDAGMKVFDDKITKLTEKIKGADKGIVADLQAKIGEYEKRKHMLVHEMKPVTKESYSRELASAKGQYESKIRETKAKFTKDLGRTTIQGADSLFKEFEEIMGFTNVNLSASKDLGDGSSATLESIVREPNKVDPEKEMIIRSDFIINLEKFNIGIDSLDDNTAKVLRLHLGLDKDNEPYAHGLWGVPMENIGEIVEALPKGFYPKLRDEQSGLKDRVKTWKERKPERVMTVKRSDASVVKRKQDLKDWEKRRTKAKKVISKKIALIRGKDAKEKFRENTYKRHSASNSQKPTDIKTYRKRLSDKELKAMTASWKKSKPTEVIGKEATMKRVSRDLVLGKVALKQIVPMKVYRNLMENYSDMRAYNIRKSHLKEDLQKSMTVDRFFGFKVVLAEQDNILIKAFKRVRALTDSLFKNVE